jgi:hypothetical protein
MRQYNTNMEQASYYAYCSAWTFVMTDSCSRDDYFYLHSIRNGIVFG